MRYLPIRKVVIVQKLYRSRRQQIIAGVCGGIAEYFQVDVTLVRLAWALIFFAGGTGGLLYLIAWIIIPTAPAEISDRPDAASSREEQPATGEAAERPAGKPDERGRIVGLLLIGLGAYFLLENILPRLNFGKLWPFGLVALGVIVLLGGKGEQ